MARRRGHTEEQILTTLRQVETGTTVTEICRQVGIAERRSIRGNENTPASG